MARVCLDASLVLLWLLPDELSVKADALWRWWHSSNVELICPLLLYAEVPSVLREAAYHRRITIEEADATFAAFCGLPLRPVLRDDLHRHAWELGKLFNAPRLYDFQYLALADLEQCELWTADQRLVNLVQRRWPWARWVGDVELEATSDDASST